jgi:hypothetical protein
VATWRAGWVLALGLATACQTGSDSAAPSSTEAVAPTSATNAEPSKTTTSIASFSFDPAARPPTLTNSGDDLVVIARSLLRYANWLLSHRPEEALVGKVAAPGSAVLASLRDDIQTLRRTDRRLLETTERPEELTVVSNSGDAASVREVQYLTSSSVVDRSGRVVSDAPLSTTTYSVLMVRLRDGHWYLAEIDELSS